MKKYVIADDAEQAVELMAEGYNPLIFTRIKDIKKALTSGKPLVLDFENPKIFVVTVTKYRKSRVLKNKC